VKNFIRYWLNPVASLQQLSNITRSGIGEADSDPRITSPTENLLQKAARTTIEDDSEEPA